MEGVTMVVMGSSDKSLGRNHLTGPESHDHVLRGSFFPDELILLP